METLNTKKSIVISVGNLTKHPSVNRYAFLASRKVHPE